MLLYNSSIIGNRIRRTFNAVQLLCIVFLFLFSANAFARNVSFTWTANTDTPNVDGYKLYYKIGDPGATLADYNGTDASNGVSPRPISGWDTTTYLLENLLDSNKYSFVLTAYRGEEESAPTTPITLPANTPTTEKRTVNFTWTANTDEPPVTGYKLYYKLGDPGLTLPDYDGTDADNGNPSPIEILGPATNSHTLGNLLRSEKYSFVLTAFRDQEESLPTTAIVLDGIQVNNPPVATDVAVDVDENSSVTSQLQGSDADNDPLVFSVVTNPSSGSVNITDTATGAFTYTPGADATGPDSFTFKANDGSADSNVATVSVTIAAVNKQPTATASTLPVTEDQTASGQLAGTDPDGDTLSYIVVSTPSKGVVENVNPGTGSFTYAPNANATGSDSFLFKVSDGQLESDPAIVNVTIASVNDPPSASDSTLNVDEDSSGSGQLSASDVDAGDTLTYSIIANGSSGTASVTASTGAFTYTPDSDATGSDSFTFKVSDGELESGPATVSITIANVNDPPTASGADMNVDEDSSLSGQLTATDVDIGDTLTYSIVNQGGSGVASITPGTGAFTYTPNENIFGEDTFSFKVNDGELDSNTATVNIAIAPVNDPPVAEDLSVDVDEDSSASGQLAATDIDGDDVTYSIIANGNVGTASITPSTGAFTYTPTQNATGEDSFTFRVSDGVADSNTATVSVSIAGVNDQPVAEASTLAVEEDLPASGQLTATDPDEGDALTYVLVTDGTSGSVTITDDATGDYTYTPKANVSGEDTFSFKVNDGTLDSAEALVTVTISAVNDPPLTSGQTISTDMNTMYTGRLFADDVDGDNLTYSIIKNPDLGVLTITDSATGAFTYAPNLDASGSDLFSFAVNDGTVASAETEVNVTVFSATVIAKTFGDVPGADYPGTLADTYANLNTDINEGAESLKTYSWSAGSPYKAANTIIMKAELADVPDYATIVEARLFLFQDSSSGATQYSNSIHKIIGKNPIIEQVTGYNAFNGEAWTPVPPDTTHDNVPLGLADIDEPEDSILLFTQDGYRSWVITSMVQEWVTTPSTNLGLLIQGEQTTQETARNFAASENQNTDVRPKLLIRYRLIPPAPKLILIEEIK